MANNKKTYQKFNDQVRKNIIKLISLNNNNSAIGTINKNGFPIVSKAIPMLFKENIYLLLSDLSEHTKNIKDEKKTSLYFSSKEVKKDRLNNERLTLIGETEKLKIKKDDFFFQKLLYNYSIIEPNAKIWGKFSDFNFYLFINKETLFIKGFGKAFKTNENIFK